MKTFDSSAVAGSVRLTLRLEGLVLFAAAIALYARTDAAWSTFAWLFLVPDLSLAAYILGPKVGAAAYNAVHSEIGPVALGLSAFSGLVPTAWLAVALIWLAHVGFDRACGYGLKYSSAFGDTHLGRVGKRKSATPVLAGAHA